MKKFFILFFAFLLFLSPSILAKDKPVVLLTGSKGGTYYRFGKAIQKLDRTLKVQTSSGSLANLNALSLGQADLAFCQMDVFWKMFTHPSTHKLFQDLRIVLPLYQEEIHLLVRSESGISHLKDLVGKTVSAGELDSGSLITTQTVLKALSIDDKQILWDYSAPKEALQKLLSGQVDALFLTGGQPLSLLQRLPKKGWKKIRFLPLSSREQKKIHARAPFYKTTALLPKAYPFLSKKIPTLGVPSLLLCYEGLSSKRISRLCQVIYSHLGQLKRSHPKWKEVSFAKGRALASQSNYPFHQGARNYFLREVLTPETLRFASGSKGGTYYQIALDLQRALLPQNLKILPLPSKGSISNLLSLILHQTDLALCQMDSLILLHLKSPKISDQIGVVLPLYLEELHILVRKGAGIHSMADLKGKRVNMGTAASGTNTTVALILSLNNVDYQRDFQMDLSPPKRALKKLLSGKLDCLFFTGGSPLTMLSKIPAKEGEKIQLLSLRKKEFAKVQFFFSRLGLPRPYQWVKISKRTYPCQPKDVFTLATPALMVGRMGHQRRAILQLLETVFSRSNRLYHPKWKELKFGKVRKILFKLPLPIHEAMAEYLYRQDLKQVQHDFDLFNKAISQYQRDIKKVPTKLSALTKAPKGLKNWKGPYLSKLPRDPWGNSYILKVPGRWGMDFEILSLGRDGKKGGKGKDRDLSSWEGNIWIGHSGTSGKGQKFSPRERSEDKRGD